MSSNDQRAVGQTTVVLPSPDVEIGQASGDPDPVVRLLEDWLTDESGYDDEAWPELREALDRERERLGMHPLFGG